MESKPNDRFRLLGFSSENWANLVDNIKHDYESFCGPGNYEAKAKANPIRVRLNDANICFSFLMSQHFGLNFRNEDEPSKYLNLGVEVVDRYFYGDHVRHAGFQDRMSRDESNLGLEWVEPYRCGLLFALLNGDSDKAIKFSEWILPTLPFDETMFLLKKADNFFYKVLAGSLSGREALSERAAILGARSRRPKLLLKTLEAIEENNAEGFRKGLLDYVKLFLKQEFRETGLLSYISIDGTILWSIALDRGMTPNPLPAKEMATIATRESLGLLKEHD